MFEISFGAIAAIISTCTGLGWIISFSNKWSGRMITVESRIDHLEQTNKKLEEATNRDKLEELVARICNNVVRSDTFKNSMKETMKEVLHQEQRERSDEDKDALHQVLAELKKLNPGSHEYH